MSVKKPLSFVDDYLDDPELQDTYWEGWWRLERADELYQQGVGLLELLWEEVSEGLWLDEGLVMALKGCRQRHGLRLKEVSFFVEAHDGANDLSLRYVGAWQGEREPFSKKDFRRLEKFFVSAPQGEQSAFWTMTLLREAHAYLLEWQADALYQAALGMWLPVMDVVQQRIEEDPFDMKGWLLQLDLLYHLGDLARFEARYERFRDVTYNERHEKGRGFPWLRDLLYEETWRDKYFDPLLTLLDRVIMVKMMRNRAHDAELAYLTQLREDLHEPIRIIPVVPHVELFKLKVPSPKQMKRLEGLFAMIIAQSPPLTPPNTRGGIKSSPPSIGAQFKVPPLVLGGVRGGLVGETMSKAGASPTAHLQRSRAVWSFWQAFLRAKLLDLVGCQEILAQLAVDKGDKGHKIEESALGVLGQGLRGEVAYYAGRYEEALHSLQDAHDLAVGLLARYEATSSATAQVSVAAQAFLARLNQWRGNAHFFLADYRLAERFYEQVARFLTDDDLEGNLLHAINQGNLAFLRHNLVDHRGYVTYEPHEQLLARGERPEPFLRLKYDKNRKALEVAQTWYEEALKRAERLPDYARPSWWQAIINANLGNVSWARAKLLVEASAASESLGAELLELGSAEALYRTALGLHSDAYQTVLTLSPADRALAAVCLANISELHIWLEQYNEAEDAANACLLLLSKDATDASNNSALLATEGVYFPESCWRVYLSLARAYEGRGQRTEAEQAYERARQVVEAMRGMIHLHEWQVTSLQEKLEFFEHYMHFLYHSTSRDAYATFDCSEQLKARAFLDMLEAAQLNVEALLPAELAQRRQQLAAEFAARNNAIREALQSPSSSRKQKRINSLLAEQKALAMPWQRLQSEIQAAQQAAGELNPPPLTWAQFQPFLQSQPDTVVLSFVIGTQHSYLLICDADGVYSFELPSRATIEFAVARLIWYAQNGQNRFADFFKANRQVVEILFGAALEGLVERLRNKRVVIMPDGILYYLPFELLLIAQPLDDAGLPINPEQHRADIRNRSKRDRACYRDLLPFYLHQQALVSYAQSATVWRILQERAPSQADHSLMGVYNINYHSDELQAEAHQKASELGIIYQPLPQTRRVKRVLAAYEAQNTLALSAWDEHNQPMPLERQSNEGNFKLVLDQTSVRYLLFAGHGVFNDKYAHFSGLIFNLAPLEPVDENDENNQNNQKAQTAHTQDGFFGLNDIFDLQLPETDLVFLAACQSGLGTLSRGEGVNALTRAFMQRGASSVIASLWSVDVKATMDLVEAFFQQLQSNPEQDHAQALHAAKNTLLAKATQKRTRTPHYVYPHYWAPFVLFGKR